MESDEQIRQYFELKQQAKSIVPQRKSFESDVEYRKAYNAFYHQYRWNTDEEFKEMKRTKARETWRKNHPPKTTMTTLS